MCPVYDAAEQAAALVLRATFAPLGTMSLVGTRGAKATAGDGAVRAVPDEIRGIADTARALADFGEAAAEVAVRLCDARGDVVGAIDFTWRLTARR